MCIFGNRPWTGIVKICPDLVKFAPILHAPPWGDARALDAPATSQVLWEVSDNTGDEEESIADSAGLLRVL